MPGDLLVPTPLGDARLLVSEAPEPAAVLVLGHGAAGGAGAADLVALADALPTRTGVTVIRVEQPWRVAGRRVAPAPAVLDRGWRAVITAIRDGRPEIPAGRADLPLLVGGRSAGARVACRTAAELGAAAVVALAFPLHPPGRPERSRLDELTGAGVPVLVVQGERDSFGRPGEFPPGPYELVVVPGADHGFSVPRSSGVSRRQALEFLVDTVVDTVIVWLRPRVGHPDGHRAGRPPRKPPGRAGNAPRDAMR